ncbi:phage minor head protein [Glutamicibacter sp. V16R2B1]|uniref:phage minor head protein n=1 Tax=Glutamicibacter sp. V16R2B1 TaxID=2036207 RepID=UPI0010FDC79B|nr:phage minor head protein [Glutamicibacter sp. V16R2B1]TLK56308.1 phage head morphogenesis protein [Glutamicibacter sp. V16R2B1]
MAVTDETLLAAADTRRRLQRLTDEQVVALTRAWVEAWDDLAPLFNEAFLELLQGAEGRLPRAVIARNRKLQSALKQARATLNELAAAADEIIGNEIAGAILDAVDGHQQILRTQLPPATAGVGFDLDAPDPGALDAIVARTTQQIHSATRPLAGWVVAAMRKELIRGIAVGSNPREVARKLIASTEGHFNGGLARALTIARTELIDAHRAGSLASAKQNRDLLAGWRWQCTLDRRTCPACLAKHGTMHSVDEFGPEGHANCRCARVDVTKSWKELGFTTVPEPEDDFPDAKNWFDGLTEDSQLAIMGPKRLQLLQDGDIGWDDLATKRHTDGWRDSYVATPVKDLHAVAG